MKLKYCVTANWLNNTKMLVMRIDTLIKICYNMDLDGYIKVRAGPIGNRKLSLHTLSINKKTVHRKSISVSLMGITWCSHCPTKDESTSVVVL